MEKMYRVIKDIDEGWEAIVVTGDILRCFYIDERRKSNL